MVGAGALALAGCATPPNGRSGGPPSGPTTDAPAPLQVDLTFEGAPEEGLRALSMLDGVTVDSASLARLRDAASQREARCAPLDLRVTMIARPDDPVDDDVVWRSDVQALWRDAVSIARIDWRTHPRLPLWPTAARNADLRHLDGAPRLPEASFLLTPRVLETLRRANAFNTLPGAGVIVFGLRGAMLADPSDAGRETTSVRLIEATPDHLNLRCVIGVWRQAGGRSSLTAYPASTVPNADQLELATRRRGRAVSNVLPTGLHRRTVWTHGEGSQIGALRHDLDAQACVLRVARTGDGPGELVADGWWDLRRRADGSDSRTTVFDNVHAGMFENFCQGPKFSSAGCCVIPGRYPTPTTPQGLWADFFLRLEKPMEQLAACVKKSRYDAQPGERGPDCRFPIDFMLLTGREACLAAGLGDNDYRARFSRLRYGSGVRPGEDVSIDADDRRGLDAVALWNQQRSVANPDAMGPLLFGLASQRTALWSQGANEGGAACGIVAWPAAVRARIKEGGAPT